MHFKFSSLSEFFVILAIAGAGLLASSVTAQEKEMKPVETLAFEKLADREPAASQDNESKNKDQPFIGRPTSRTVSKDGYIFDVESERGD